jgi:lipopolysaccharide/colanic/teichoic acid biosynthesis glycosyltransferase
VKYDRALSERAGNWNGSCVRKEGVTFKGFEATGDARLMESKAIRLKYLLDRPISLALAATLLPLGLFIVAAIVVESILTGEPLRVFMFEPRRSAGRAFQLIKFRSFRVQAIVEQTTCPEQKGFKALESSEHYTRVGRILGRCYLDELPQLLNIIRGEMSLVGPRPYFEGDWKRERRLGIRARCLLKAGLVGPSQARKGEISELESVNAIDTDYLNFCLGASFPDLFLKDIRLMVQSLRIVLRAQGL